MSVLKGLLLRGALRMNGQTEKGESAWVEGKEKHGGRQTSG